MILQLAPDASPLAQAAAATVLFLHVAGGSVGMASGAVALLSRKGERLHRAAGNVFFASMLVMGAVGAVVSPMLGKRLDSVMGVFAMYLVATGWATVKRREGTIGRFEIVACVVGFGAAAANLTFGLMAANSAKGTLSGFDAATYFIFGALIAFAAVMDLKVIFNGGISGAPRIARHLWRMCLALLLALASFFLGQSQLFPAAIRHSNLLFVPEIAAIILLVFWMFRVRFTNAFKSAA